MIAGRFYSRYRSLNLRCLSPFAKRCPQITGSLTDWVGREAQGAKCMLSLELKN